MILDSLAPTDRVQLHELYGRSVMLLELGRCKEWAELFEPSAVFQCASTAGKSEFKGHADLLRLAQQITSGEFDLALGPTHAASNNRHLLHNICFFQEGLHHVRSYAHVSVMSIKSGEPPHFLASGLYADRLSKCGSGCWRFAARYFTLDGLNESSTATNTRHPAVLSVFPSH